MARTERIQQQSESQLDPRRPQTWLIRIGSARDPQQEPEVIHLQGRCRLVLGRMDGPPTMDPDRLECRDRWMSGEHAALECGEQGWLLSDLGSANGTLVWGQARSTHILDDGDVFETGSTFWLFRSGVLTSAEIPGPEPDPILCSLHFELTKVARRIARVAQTSVPVMLLGATGTGKEVLARAIHERSGRSGTFVAINTAAVQTNLVASELFGVERGAHSMAERSRVGLIRGAEGGTVLLDEIGDMPLEVQVSLLRVLQENEVMPVGGDTPVPINVRFICATHQDLSELVSEGRFRADLYARLKGATFEIPSLSERREDIGSLLGIFLRRHGAPNLDVSPAAYRALLNYEWPLNVRELEKTIETAIALSDGERIEVEHLQAEIREHKPQRANQQARAPETDDAKQRELERLLTAHGGNVSAVARSMGYSRMQVHRWLKQMGLNPDSYRRA